MSKTKIERPTLLTPPARCRWPYLNEPDTKFQADGEYRVELIYSKDDAAPIIKELEGYLKDFAKSEGTRKYASTRPWFDEIDPDTEKPTGNIVLRCKMKAIVRPKNGKEFPKRPALFGPDGQPFTEAVGAGSVLRVSITVNCWNVESQGGCGITLWPDAVQVLQHRPPYRREAADYGFAPVDPDEYDEASGDF